MRTGCRLMALAVAPLLLAGRADAAEPVDLELVLAADASGSIDDGEIRLQREGYAAAITSGEILQAIGVGYLGRIAVTYVEWGAENSQAVVAPWQVIDGPASAAAFAQTLRTIPRQAFGRNAIGSVIDFAQRQIEGNAFPGERLVIDVSADSAYSWNGVPLALARERALEAGITINGLAVLCRSCSGRPARRRSRGRVRQADHRRPGQLRGHRRRRHQLRRRGAQEAAARNRRARAGRATRTGCGRTRLTGEPRASVYLAGTPW